MKEKIKKAAMAAGAGLGVVGAACLGAYVTTRYLMSVAMDRREPELVKQANKMISGAKNVDHNFWDELDRASEKLQARENEEITITASDGETLIGHWFEHPSPRRIIVAMHGWRAAWHRDFGTVADYWFDHGCSVLFAEQRGQNNSGGDRMGFGVRERFDTVDWVKWVNERCPGGLPVYLCGVSMGATTVLMAAGLELPDNVRGIIADCGFTSPGAIFRHVANNNLHMIYGIRSVFADAMFRQAHSVGAEEISTLDALKKTKIPVLFVHGTDDKFVPISMTYENYKACASPKRLFVVPGADHGMSYYVDPKGYEAAVENFWRDFDAPAEEAV